MALYKNFLFIFQIFFFSLCATQTLKKADIQTTFEEMLRFHVEHKEISPLLITRAVKIFIENFDVLKMYLMENEAYHFFHLSEKKIEKGVKDYHDNEILLFSEINHFIQGSILRARKWREEIQKELILSIHDAKSSFGETYLSFASDEDQLKKRIRKQQMRLLFEEKEQNQLEEWAPVDREKIFHLWEKRFHRNEDKYLLDNPSYEHAFAMHSLKALAKSLDAHSAFYSPEEALELRAALEKQFEGVGVVLSESISGVVIADLIKGGPAEKSGKITVGDVIVEIDGKPVEGMTYEQILSAMEGKEKKDLKLSLRHRGSIPLQEVTLIREKIMMSEERLQYQSYPCSNGHIGILTLPSFYEGGYQSNAEYDMREAIKKLKSQAPLKGMVLDMRENSGGFLTQAVKIAGIFISKGVIVISKYSHGEIKYLRNLDGRLIFDGPLVVLTSRASASAAEIVAQALQDYGVALVVGDEETYGEGTIQYQTVTDKEAKSFYKVTIGRYYTVSGRSTQIEGVKADIVVPTIFASYKIGERFLEYPLSSDHVASAYIDPLTDLDLRSRQWFQKNYLPSLHQFQDKWHKILPILKDNSRQRLEGNKNFSLFMKAQEKIKGRSPRAFQRIANPPWGNEDLQLSEAIHIIQDMNSLTQESP